MHFRLISILIAFALTVTAGCQSTKTDDGQSRKFFSPDYTSPSLDLSKYSGSKLGDRKSIKNSDKTWFDSGSKSLDVRFQSLDTGYDSAEKEQTQGDDIGYELELELDSPDGPDQSDSLLGEFVSDLRSDLGNFYNVENAPWVLGALGIGGLMANTSIDQDILDHVQDNITFARSDELGEFIGESRFFGEGYFLLPVYAGSAIIGKHFLAGYPAAWRVGEWGDRSFRGILLGAPPLLISQRLLGGSRPNETGEGSEWQPFADNNAVSGHAFMGAVPFLTAMRMTDDYRARTVWFALSTLPALSRITENGHYPSQALLGWGLACLATSSVANSEFDENRDFQVYPVFEADSVGVGVTIRH